MYIKALGYLLFAGAAICQMVASWVRPRLLRLRDTCLRKVRHLRAR